MRAMFGLVIGLGAWAVTGCRHEAPASAGRTSEGPPAAAAQAPGEQGGYMAGEAMQSTEGRGAVARRSLMLTSTLKPLSASGVIGWATLTARAGVARAVLEIDGAPAGNYSAWLTSGRDCAAQASDAGAVARGPSKVIEQDIGGLVVGGDGRGVLEADVSLSPGESGGQLSGKLVVIRRRGATETPSQGFKAVSCGRLYPG